MVSVVPMSLMFVGVLVVDGPYSTLAGSSPLDVHEDPDHVHEPVILHFKGNKTAERKEVDRRLIWKTEMRGRRSGMVRPARKRRVCRSHGGLVHTCT